MAHNRIHAAHSNEPDDTAGSHCVAFGGVDEAAERSTLQVFDQRGATLEVDVTATRKRVRLPDGGWSDWKTGPLTLSLRGEPVVALDEQTLEVVSTTQRLSLHPPLSGG